MLLHPVRRLYAPCGRVSSPLASCADLFCVGCYTLSKGWQGLNARDKPSLRFGVAADYLTFCWISSTKSGVRVNIQLYERNYER